MAHTCDNDILNKFHFSFDCNFKDHFYIMLEGHGISSLKR